MGSLSDTFMVYTCDNCSQQVVLGGVVGGPLGGPTGWKSVTPATTSDGDWLCSYKCLSEWAGKMQVQYDEFLKAKTVKVEESNGSSDTTAEQ